MNKKEELTYGIYVTFGSGFFARSGRISSKSTGPLRTVLKEASKRLSDLAGAHVSVAHKGQTIAQRDRNPVGTMSAWKHNPAVKWDK